MADAPQVRITVDGRLALTTRQIAAERGVSIDTARKEIRRLAVEPVAHLDERTPLYPAVVTRTAYKARPGKGAHLRKESR